jgi:hypothetical protein
MRVGDLQASGPAEELQTPPSAPPVGAEASVVVVPSSGSVSQSVGAAVPPQPRGVPVEQTEIMAPASDVVNRRLEASGVPSSTRNLWWIIGGVTGGVVVLLLVILLSTSSGPSPTARFLNSMGPFSDQARKLVGRYETGINYMDYNVAVGELAAAYTNISTEIPNEECRSLARKALNLKLSFQSAATSWRASVRGGSDLSYLGRSRIETAHSEAAAFLAEYDLARKRAR